MKVRTEVGQMKGLLRILREGLKLNRNFKVQLVGPLRDEIHVKVWPEGLPGEFN